MYFSGGLLPGAGLASFLLKKIPPPVAKCPFPELNAIQVCLSYVDAQKEFALRKARQGEGVPEYAQWCVNGLYWEAGEGEEPSPMGPLFAAAREEGYGATRLVYRPAAGGRPIPYHGYFFRILKAQGEHAPGGAWDYVVGGKMIGS